MPKMTSAILGDKRVGIDEAIRLWDEAKKRKTVKPFLQCDECRQSVRPHKSGGNMAAHFEHHERNSECSQSHRQRG
jgi:hypothetical protein